MILYRLFFVCFNYGGITNDDLIICLLIVLYLSDVIRKKKKKKVMLWAYSDSTFKYIIIGKMCLATRSL